MRIDDPFGRGIAGLFAGILLWGLGSRLYSGSAGPPPAMDLFGIWLMLAGVAVAVCVPAWYVVCRDLDRRLPAFAGAVGVPLSATVLLGILGYGEVVTTDWRPWIVFHAPVNAPHLFILWSGLGAFGTGIGLVRGSKRYASVAVTLVALVLVPMLDTFTNLTGVPLDLPLFGTVGVGLANADVYSIAPLLGLLGAVGCLFVAAEYVIRNYQRVRATISTQRAFSSLGVGLAHLIVVVFASAIGHGEPHRYSATVRYAQSGAVPEFLLVLSVLVGLTLLGSIPALLLEEWGLVSPVVLTAMALGYTLFGTWQQVTDPLIVLGQSAPLTIDTYAVFWFVPLGAALLAGAVERSFRTRSGAAVPTPYGT